MKRNLILKLFVFVSIIASSYFLYCLFKIFVIDEVKKRELCAEKTTNKKDFIYCIENAYLSDRHGGLINYRRNPI